MGSLTKLLVLACQIEPAKITSLGGSIQRNDTD